MSKLKQPLRVILNLLGALLGVAGVVFVLLRIRDHADRIELQNRGAVFWLALGLLTLAYGSANLLLARAWWSLLSFLGARTAWPWALRAYGLSQLAKYVPGNFFHLAGRQALGQAAGLPAKPMAKSIGFELVLIASAGALFSALALPLLLPSLPPSAGSMAYLLVLGATVVGVRRWQGVLVARALVQQSLFLVISGAVFVSTLALLNPHALRAEIVPMLCGAYIVSWLIGFVTPGAPAGLGVRELALLFLLERQLPTGALLSAVLLARLISMLGDLLFFAASSGLRSRAAPE